MGNLPNLNSLMSPAHTLLMVIIICGVGLVICIMLLISKLMNGRVAAVPQMPDAELDRRRRVLELERMELEVQERKQRLAS